MVRTRRTLIERDIGKHVVNADGDRIGVLANIEDGVGYADPEPGLADRVRSRLGWGQIEEDDYPIERSQVAEITADEIRLHPQ